jgi:2-polyprenyl-3-methyl-5-hydroxy-6-metoxy-1,4-benzoquinol methylase
VPKICHNSSPEEYESSRSGHFEDHRVRLIDDCLSRRHRLQRVVELGCGTGVIAQRLARTHPTVQFHGVDIDERLLAYARETHDEPNLTWWPELPSCSLTGTVDAVYSIDVIHHLQDRPAVFADVRKLLAADGMWIVIEPNIWHPVISWQQERMKRSQLGEDHFRPWAVHPEWRGAGFEIRARRYWHLWPATKRRLPGWALGLERRLEGWPLCGGSVVYEVAAA